MLQRGWALDTGLGGGDQGSAFAWVMRGRRQRRPGDLGGQGSPWGWTPMASCGVSAPACAVRGCAGRAA